MTELLPGLEVSRETWARLETHVALLRKWTAAINLVSRATLDDVWDRHIRDSAQLVLMAPEAPRHWVDLGSGGGFPGLVVAILLAERAPGARVTLVESDARKAAFLASVARETGVKLEVLASRAEAVAPLGADVLSARALAPLVNLLPLAARHLAPDGVALLPKGARAGAEIREALAGWRFTVQKTPSLSDPSALVLKMTEISRA